MREREDNGSSSMWQRSRIPIVPQRLRSLNRMRTERCECEVLFLCAVNGVFVNDAALVSRSRATVLK